MTPLPNSMYKALLDRLDGLVPDDPYTWTEADGLTPQRTTK